MTRLIRAVVAMIAVAWSGLGEAAPQCQEVAPLRERPSLSQVSSPELGVAVTGQKLAIWPLGTAKLNPEAGVEVTFSGGSSCISAFTEAGSDGISLYAGKAVAAVEAAVCQADGSLCVPVRVEFGR